MSDSNTNYTSIIINYYLNVWKELLTLTTLYQGAYGHYLTECNS